MVEKYLHKNCHSMKDTIKSLVSLEVKPQQIIKDMGFFTCDILLPTPEKCMSEVSCELIMKDLIIQTEHKGRQWTKVAVFEVTPHVYLSQYGQVLDTTSLHECGMEFQYNVGL